MLAELVRRGYVYDSSIFPAPAYYAAKAAVMAGLHLLGRPSGAVMTEPRAVAAPTEPYRPAMRAPRSARTAARLRRSSVTASRRMPSSLYTGMTIETSGTRSVMVAAL